MKRRWRPLALLLACGACEAAPRTVTAVDAHAASAVDAAQPAVAPPRREPKPREVHVKAAAPESAELTSGARLSAHQALSLIQGSEVTLDFERGARVRVVGPAQVAMALDAKDALLLKEGVVAVDLAPSAPTLDSGFTLFTPSGKFSLVRGGRYAVRVFEDGASHVFVASGSVGASSANAEKELLLGAEESALLPLNGAVEHRRHEVQTLAKAEQQALALRAPKHAGGSAAMLAALDQLLVAQIASAQPLVAKEHELVRQHRALLRVADADVLGAQRQLAENAAHLAQALGGLRSALAQRAAARLGGEASDDELAASAQRILQRLP